MKVGQKVGPFDIEKKIGSGAMGSVYCARYRKTGQRVAIKIMPDGTLKLTDFGIAKDLDVTQLTNANCTVGTAAYMSPEQCRGERNLTHKSDLYSLGVVLFELLTGHKPFDAETTMDMFLQH